jgi:hypothetical protein
LCFALAIQRQTAGMLRGVHPERSERAQHDSTQAQRLAPRVAHTLCFMYAPHEHAQHPCHRVLSVACPGLLTVTDIKGDVGATREFANV